MKVSILNRANDFEHPVDGWYQIEAKGRHPNARAGVVQIVDDEACAAIAAAFNREARAPGFPGMLIDIEHFKYNEEKETRSYGWLMALQNRADGLYGQIRWTGTGQKAVDDGDYRFFSTEYDPAKMTVLNKGSNPKQVRPTELAGLTLTNVNNNKGQKPITNRENKDGIKIYLPDIGWLLIRASGTENLLRLYSETNNPAITQKVLETVTQMVRKL